MVKWARSRHSTTCNGLTRNAQKWLLRAISTRFRPHAFTLTNNNKFAAVRFEQRYSQPGRSFRQASSLSVSLTLPSCFGVSQPSAFLCDQNQCVQKIGRLSQGHCAACLASRVFTTICLSASTGGALAACFAINAAAIRRTPSDISFFGSGCPLRMSSPRSPT